MTASSSPANPHAPLITIIMPVHNGAQYLHRSIAALPHTWPANTELIIVDDASTDSSITIARSLLARYPAGQLLTHPTQQGAAAARNTAARTATGDILLFLDCDIAVHPDALDKILSTFNTNPQLHAIFGSYDDNPADPHLISQFRNLLHHHIHQQGRGPATTFWTGLGAVRRQTFDAIGGFRHSSLHLMEDIDFGYRLTAAGYNIQLHPDIQGTHLKRWTLLTMLQTDLIRRAIPWTQMLLQNPKARPALNLQRKERATALAVLLLLLPLLIGHPFIPTLALATFLLLQKDFYRLLIRRLGLLRATLSIPLHILYFLTSLTGLALGIIIYSIKKLAPSQIP